MSLVNAQLMNEEELRQWILRRLGAPLHQVQLCEQHVTDAVETARRWFSAKKGVIKLFFEDVVPNQVEYTLNCEIDKVLDVSFSDHDRWSFSYSFYPLLDRDLIPYEIFSAGPQGRFSTYVQVIQQIEMARRILSAELDWRQEGRKLFVTPAPHDVKTMLIEAKIHWVKIEELTERDHDLVKRYALAKAREDLAWVLGKYGYPGASGDITINFDRLYDQAREELEKLEEEISESGKPAMFILG